MAKKKKSIYSRRLKDVNKDGKRNFGDTFLGDLLGADGKVGIGKGRPGLIDSLKGKRREEPITKKPKAKPNRKKKNAKPNVRVGIKTSTTVVTPKTKTDRGFKPSNVQPKDRTSGTPSFRTRKKVVSISDLNETANIASRAIDKDTGVMTHKEKLEVKLANLQNKADKAKLGGGTVPKNIKVEIRNIERSLAKLTPGYADDIKVAVGSGVDKVKSVLSRERLFPKRSGNSKGGMIDYRKTGMFYGGMTKRGKK
mgnify:CR=1 FL=1